MKIKSAKSFRFWYKTKVKEIDKINPSYNENFVGTYHNEGGKKIKGFFEMYHGDKPDIAGYLPSILQIAEDGQAIYEFLQNAVDCNSTHFYIFYNEKYFLAINNGEPFDIDGLQSILNIAQTTKKDADKIGRFGIGFKLAHRLVGKNEGTEELCRQYKGPILFSWLKLADLESLLNDETITPIQENDSTFSTAPYLLKLLLTNFPSDPNESVKDINYQDRILFPQEELKELVSFLKENFQQHSATFTKDALKQGSLFFIKLGEGKKAILDKDYSELKNGIEYSMNTLKKLEKVYFNSDDIKRIPLQLESGTIGKNTEEFKRIDPEYKEFDIKFAIGFNQLTFGNDNTYSQIKTLKEKPNFYKYFPMGDEINGFGFMIHCDSFSNEANRRKLHEDEINRNLFPEIAQHIISRLDHYKKTDRNKFLNLYSCLLLSDIPDRQNNKWLRTIFYDTLLEYIKTNVPTNGSFGDNPQNVKINRLKTNLNLSEFGLKHIQWFEWKDNNDQILLDEAKNKLGIGEWDIRDIVENANLDSINNWIANCDKDTYQAFLKELEDSSLRQKTKEQIGNIKLFKFSDGLFYSFNEIVGKGDVVNKCSEVVVCNHKIVGIKDVLGKLGFITSNLTISVYPKIYGSIQMPTEKSLYGYIAEKCKTNTLSSAEKKKLFQNFTNEHTKFTDVGEATLKELCLFADKNGQIKPLKDLISSTLQTPDWLQNWVIKSDEYFPELNSYLIAEAAIYPTIILNFWDYLITQTADIKNLYDKTIYYYGLKDSNISLWKKGVKFVYTKNGFMQANQVFFNSKMTELDSAYTNFQNAAQSLFALPTPDKSIISFLLKEPFRLDGSNFTGRRFNKTQLEVNEIKSTIKFCKLNNEQFFKNCIVEKNGNMFYVIEKTEDKFQITSPDEKARKFINEHCSDKLIVLPYEFLEYKDEDGIVKSHELHRKIIKCIDVDEHKESLVDIVAYEAKLQFLQELSEIRLSSDIDYSKDSYEYKVLELACGEIQGGETQKFRNQIVIESNGSDLLLSEIPSSADKVVISGKELSQSQILPNKAKNGNVLSDLLEQFVTLGLQKEKLYELFGIQSETDPKQIFELLKNDYTILENVQQLAFLLLYDKEIENVKIEQFKVETLDEKSWELKYSYYAQAFAFIGDDYLLKPQYSEIKKLLNLPVKIGNSDNRILAKPYFDDDSFVCPSLKSDLSEEEKIQFIDFLYSEWGNESNKSKIKNIDWNKINDTETDKVLGFNPNKSVYPSEYACESEQLPEYLMEWIGENNDKISFLSDVGVWVEDSVIVELRKFWLIEGGSFNKTRLSQTTRFNDDETMLFNSFEWLKEKGIELNEEQEYETFKKVVEVINDNRKTRNAGELVIQEEFDFEKLEENSEEWNEDFYQKWKDELDEEISIFLYDGALPKTVGLDEISDYIFYRYNNGDSVINENIIYLNKNADIKRLLEIIVYDEDNGFTTDDLSKLFGNEIDKLREENERLKRLLSPKSDAVLSTGDDYGLSKNEQIETNREAKEIVKERLENEGYEFSKGIEEYSTIDGVMKDGVEYPLVVKSYKYTDAPLKIGANEWIQLMKPNSMFWVHFGNRKLGCLNLFDLLRKQDKLSISFSTENLDIENRLDKFADLLHYFKEVHLDFNNLNPNNYNADYFADYRFDQRQSEEDLSSDNDNLL